MTTRVKILNEGPQDVLVRVSDQPLGDVLKPGQFTERHVWQLQHVTILEVPPTPKEPSTS